jgi:adenosylcobyric acid synthase
MPALMFQGTGSSVGKSLLVAGLCRAARNRGLLVLPFKPQNMSNNAAVTEDGGEIGRAQALQARAAGVAPSVHMNPVLLKPQSETGAQIVVQGRVRGAARAREYQAMKAGLLPDVLESFRILSADADLVLVEGAGSASEVNLRAHDIANMGFARAAKVPVVLIGDIDRGGVIASLVGTRTVLDADDAAMIQGFIVNRMRGDTSLFAEGMRIVARHTGWAPLGLVPYFPGAEALPAEDAMELSGRARQGAGLRVVALCLPMIANFDDFDPLGAEPGVDLRLIRTGTPIPDCDLVILPGSKSTLADLAALRAAGWDIDLLGHVRRGGRVLGLCGGYQMLGTNIADPDGIEGRPGSAPGVGLLDVETVLGPRKELCLVSGALSEGAPVSGYEMHMGVTAGPDRARPLLRLDDGRDEGAVSADGRVAGSYLHGLLAGDAARSALLREWGGVASDYRHEDAIEAALDGLAAHLEAHIDVEKLFSLAR